MVIYCRMAATVGNRSLFESNANKPELVNYRYGANYL